MISQYLISLTSVFTY